MSRQIQCPRCGKHTVFAPENPNRPFCSERCKLIDLGQWAEEKYTLPTTQTDLDDLEEREESGDSEPEDASGGRNRDLH